MSADHYVSLADVPEAFVQPALGQNVLVFFIVSVFFEASCSEGAVDLSKKPP